MRMNLIKAVLLPLFLSCCVAQLIAQTTYPESAVRDYRTGKYAFTNATIHVDANQVLENATMVIERGRIIGVGNGIPIGDGAVVIDCRDRHIYPSFIELDANYGLPTPKAEGKRPDRQPQELSNKQGPYSWNEALKTEFSAGQHFTTDKKAAKKLRESGFGAALTHRADGISRGTGAVVTLGEQPARESIVKAAATHHLSFNKGTSTQNYPSSLMGAIALLRQNQLDAQWYAGLKNSEETNLSLAAWNNVSALPQIFVARDKQEILRIAKLGKELNTTYIIRSAGDEYQWVNAIKATNQPLIVPLDFPEPYDVTDPLLALNTDLSELKHWELAPSNAARLAAAQIRFALTASDFDSSKDFFKALRKAINYGLTPTQALAALTTVPAELSGVADHLGSLTKGKIANFLITDGPLFDKETTLLENWVQGAQYRDASTAEPALNDKYSLTVGTETFNLFVETKKGKHTFFWIENDTTKTKINATLSENAVSLHFGPKGQGHYRLSGLVDSKQMNGTGQTPSGKWIEWSSSSAEFVVPDKKKAEKKDEKEDDETEDSEKEKEETKDLGAVWYPFKAFGWTERPTTETVLFQNATVWTNEPEGILEQADVLIADGKIKKVGKGLKANGATVIDATGKHLTSGVVDEHSHIAIMRGVNEGTQESTAEVRIGDAIDSEDIDIYRQLSGGVTASQLLHGSANPIGGQSALVKLRWGAVPEEMKIANADGFIKFALGENVKQSNWGDNYRSRFPQTRMGVEQVFVDYFTRAKEYEKLKTSGKPYRRDLDLEAILEIVNSKRFISCHSYRQSEINMLMKVAEQFGFRVNTFTHILEGYKVADKMAEHGAGGSTFSDWWAYKMEVWEAIPYNAAIMHEQGVTVAINSDDAEMARRLNQEAAKAVLYGDVSEEEAWKMVTLNPAKLLHLDDNMGSLKTGKDADVVLWSDHPLSMYARAEMTFVDGIRYFDRAQDAILRKQVAEERQRIINKMIIAQKSGAKTKKISKPSPPEYHCMDIEDELVD